MAFKFHQMLLLRQFVVAFAVVEAIVADALPLV